MGLADDRHHVVFAVRKEWDVPDQDHVVVAGNLFEGAAKHVFRVHIIAGEKFAIGLCHASRSIK
jgi:hypothetical protein